MEHSPAGELWPTLFRRIVGTSPLSLSPLPLSLSSPLSCLAAPRSSSSRSSRHPSVPSLLSSSLFYFHVLIVFSAHLAICFPGELGTPELALNMKHHHSWRQLALLAALCSLFQRLDAQVVPGPIQSSQTISILGDELYLHGGSHTSWIREA